MSAQKFTIPGAFLTRNDGEKLARAHWAKAAKAKKEETERAAAAIKGARLTPVSRPCEVTMIFHEQLRYYKNGRLRKLHDVDNWFYGTKPILDALVNEGILEDDDPFHVRRVIPVVHYTEREPYVTVAIMDYVPRRRITFAPVDIPDRRPR